MIRNLAAFALAALTTLTLACGGTTSDGDAGADAQQDVAPDTSGPYACGATTCQTGEICVHPCCGGAAPACVQADDAGVCPQGYSHSGSCFGGNGDCAPPPCTPPPPYCAPAASTGVCSPYVQDQPRDCYLTCA